jgi:hypothetical protein
MIDSIRKFILVNFSSMYGSLPSMHYKIGIVFEMLNIFRIQKKMNHKEKESEQKEKTKMNSILKLKKNQKLRMILLNPRNFMKENPEKELSLEGQVKSRIMHILIIFFSASLLILNRFTVNFHQKQF